MLSKNIFLSLIFFVFSEFAIYREELNLWLLPVMFFYSLFFSWFFTKKASLVSMISLIPIIQISLFSILQSFQVKQILVAFFTLAFYALFNLKTKIPLIILVSFVEILLSFIILFAYNLIYEVSDILMVLSVFASSFIIFISSISSILKLKLFLKFRLFYFSLIAGLIVSQLYWILIKFPFNFITASFMLFLIYYVLWEITVRYFVNTLTKKSIYILISFLVLILTVIFIIVRSLLI